MGKATYEMYFKGTPHSEGTVGVVETSLCGTRSPSSCLVSESYFVESRTLLVCWDIMKPVVKRVEDHK